jgi:transcriptional regulator with XRE-family HTH domain
MATVAANLVRFRKFADLTQEQVAREMQTSLNNIARWERGENWIGVGELKLLMDIYRRPVDHAFLDNPPWTTTGRAARHP